MKWLSKPFRDNVKFKAGEAVLAVEGWGWPRNIWSLVYALMQGKLRRKMGHHSYQVNSYKASNIVHLLLLFSR